MTEPLEEGISLNKGGKSYLKGDGKYIFCGTLSHRFILLSLLGVDMDKKTRRKIPWIRVTDTRTGTYVQIEREITYEQLNEIKNIFTENDGQNKNTIVDIDTDLDISNVNELEKSLRSKKFHPSQNL